MDLGLSGCLTGFLHLEKDGSTWSIYRRSGNILCVNITSNNIERVLFPISNRIPVIAPLASGGSPE
jgi:hypothetical protein